MTTSKTDRCGFVWTEDSHGGKRTAHENCCYRRTLPGSDRCAWHTEGDVSIGELSEARASREIREKNSPMDELIDGADLSGQALAGSFKNVSLRDADFSKADLQFAEFFESDLRGADFSRANFQETSFEKSDLRFAKLPDSGDLPVAGTDFTGADLREINFPDDLRHCSLERSYLHEHPIDFNPISGVQEKNDVIGVNDTTEILDELSSRDYFGPPTYEPGRKVCIEYWPNINVGQVLTEFGWAADFSGKNLYNTDLSGANLWRANFSNAFLENSDFSDAVLWMADFSDADLRNADFTGADLRDANLKGADLRNADLNEADLRRADISEITINGGTKCSQLYENPELSHDEWNTLARAYHNLKKVFGESGLIGKARNHHALQRRSRGLEARSRDGWANKVYLGSKLSGILTGYGVRIQNVLFWMLLLFLSSTIWYMIAGVEEGILRNVSFSIITFTTSPPKIPSGIVTQLVAMVETFFGTLLVVLLGYILGTREQF